MELDEEHILFLKKNFKEIYALEHPNIIKYRTMYLDLRKNICYLVMDYESMPNLLSFKASLLEEEIKFIIREVAKVADELEHEITGQDVY